MNKLVFGFFAVLVIVGILIYSSGGLFKNFNRTALNGKLLRLASPSPVISGAVIFSSPGSLLPQSGTLPATGL